ncbi:MAG: DUF4173 domain-containing protein [Chitinophagales bacterium]
MKFIHFCILVSTFAFTILFYEQNEGLNYLLFNLLLVTLTAFNNRSLLTKPAWLVVAAGALLSSFYVFWYGTGLPVLANWCSILALAGLSYTPNASLHLAGATGFLSLFFSFFRGFFSKALIPAEETDTTTKPARFPMIVIAISVTTLFFLLYRDSNPLFANVTDNINLNFINFSWVFFTFLGFVWMYGFFRHRSSEKLIRLDGMSSDNLPVITEEQHSSPAKWFALLPATEIFGGALLFSLLNLLLLSVNGLDVYYIWIAKRLPAGISAADYLHDGTETLVFSILLAILIILVVFRGYLNFAPKTQTLRWLCYSWIAQNVVMLFTTAQRNWWIIESSGFTRRRIGVYVYLLLCVIGLFITFLKVAQRRSNWFLFRKNAWAFYVLFLFSLPVNWDELIITFNYQRFKSLQFEYIDRNYQAELSHTSLGTLFKYYAQELQTANDRTMFTEPVLQSMYARYRWLKQEQAESDWRSYCVSKHNNLQVIEKLIADGKIPATIKLPPPRNGL